MLRATPEENAELFWGLRGGKSTLGIVTSVEIDLLPIPEFYGGAVYFDGADAGVVLREWATWCADLPESISTSIALQQLPPLPGIPEPLAGRFTVAVRYAAVGDFDEAERRLAPMRAVATPVLDTVAVMPYAAIGAVHADPVDPMPCYEHHTLLRELTAETVDVLLGAAGPDSGSVQTIVEVRMLGGAFAREGRHRSAFCHRDAAFTVATIGSWRPDGCRCGGTGRRTDCRAVAVVQRRPDRKFRAVRGCWAGRAGLRRRDQALVGRAGRAARPGRGVQVRPGGAFRGLNLRLV